jgi:hypothetical protein
MTDNSNLNFIECIVLDVSTLQSIQVINAFMRFRLASTNVKKFIARGAFKTPDLEKQFQQGLRDIQLRQIPENVTSTSTSSQDEVDDPVKLKIHLEKLEWCDAIVLRVECDSASKENAQYDLPAQKKVNYEKLIRDFLGQIKNSQFNFQLQFHHLKAVKVARWLISFLKYEFKHNFQLEERIYGLYLNNVNKDIIEIILAAGLQQNIASLYLYNLNNAVTAKIAKYTKSFGCLQRLDLTNISKMAMQQLHPLFSGIMIKAIRLQFLTPEAIEYLVEYSPLQKDGLRALYLSDLSKEAITPLTGIFILNNSIKTLAFQSLEGASLQCLLMYAHFAPLERIFLDASALSDVATIETCKQFLQIANKVTEFVVKGFFQNLDLSQHFQKVMLGILSQCPALIYCNESLVEQNALQQMQTPIDTMPLSITPYNNYCGSFFNSEANQIQSQPSLCRQPASSSSLDYKNMR